MLGKIALGKALVALSAATLSASAAGAATGHLPDSLQDKVANAVEHVGVNIPHSDDHGVARVTDGCVPAADGTFARNRGQYLAQERTKGAEAFEAAKLTRCGMPVQSKGTPGADDTSEEPSSPNSQGSDHGKAGQDHGAPATNPASVQTPNSGGLGTAGTASDGANSTGADKANPAATDGSTNAGDHPTADDHPGGRP